MDEYEFYEKVNVLNGKVASLQDVYNEMRENYCKALKAFLEAVGRPIRLKEPMPIKNDRGDEFSVTGLLINKNGNPAFQTEERAVEALGFDLGNLNLFFNVLVDELRRTPYFFEKQLREPYFGDAKNRVIFLG